MEVGAGGWRKDGNAYEMGCRLGHRDGLILGYGARFELVDGVEVK